MIPRTANSLTDDRAARPRGARDGNGARRNDHNDGNGADSGHARVFEYTGAAWTQIGADIDGEAAYDYSGTSVALSENGGRLCR